MKPEQALAVVEAVLFLENEPVDSATIGRIAGLSRREVLDAIQELQRHYAGDRHGLEIVELGGGFTFAAKQQLWDMLKPRYGKRSEAKLSRAALETLSIIAYSQPVTRQEIESIRGVSADGMIKLLMSKGLIREVGKKQAPGRPVQYGTTKEFLKTFRLASIADLPKLDELNEEKFE
ncbi:MAG: SMC-Scp complex subunit ScpB [Spirochaetaceae bacterium]|nr:MAG: SMC-Scp complex subunit ScpB [Spirochaetaceae bacterium]